MSHEPQQLAQAADANVGVRPTLENREATSKASKSIICGGERIPIEYEHVVTFVDDTAWDFEQLVHFDADRRYVHPRKTADKKGVVKTHEESKDVVDMVVIHADITTSARECYRILKMRGFSTHFMIDWDGTIYQGTDTAKRAIHAQSDYVDNVNNRSIGIDMNCLQINYARSEVAPATGELAAQFARGGERRMSESVELNGVPWRSWGYTDRQYDALIKLLKALKREFGKLQLAAPVDERGEIIRQVPAEFDLTKIGIYGHMHLTAQKFDPGPGFDWPRLLQGLTSEHNSWPVDLVFDKNRVPVKLAALLTPGPAKEAAKVYYSNTESTDLGGYYPVGRGGQWHGGVHLHAAAGTLVHSMFDGVIVAARNGAPPELGSNNFLLLRHAVQFDQQDPASVFTFYSLYMHLKEFRIDKDWEVGAKGDMPDDAAPAWVASARRVDTGTEEAQESEGAATGAKAPAASKGGDDARREAGKKQGGGGSRASDGSQKDRKRSQGSPSAHGQSNDDEDGDDDDASDGAPPDDSELVEHFRPFLDVGSHLAGLEAGEVALFPFAAKDEVRVAAGDIIGRVGAFGEDEDSTDDGVLHLEVFTDNSWRKVIDLLGVHGEHWVEAQADVDDNLTVDTEDLLRFIMPEAIDRKPYALDDFAFAARPVTTFDIVAFYNGDTGDDERRSFVRRSITRHVSEWSDKVDWFASMTKAQGWDERVAELTNTLQDEQGNWLRSFFAARLYRTLPFIWLTEKVSKHLKLDGGEAWDGQLTYFHPIHFLIWMTFHTNSRLRVLAKGRTKEQLKALRAKERKAAEERLKSQAFPEDDDHEGMDYDDTLEDVRDPSEILRELWDLSPMPGEWERTG